MAGLEVKGPGLLADVISTAMLAVWHSQEIQPRSNSARRSGSGDRKSVV